MAKSIWDAEVRATLAGARQQGRRVISLDGQSVEVAPPFPSPEDWRDQWIYFLMLDRFNNPGTPPRHMPYDSIYGGFQGGTLDGVRQQLAYVRDLGAGAIWLSPVLKNCQYSPGTYHGYGIQDFLQVEPRFASAPSKAEHELRVLVDEAHELGLYVILDIVLNHTGDVFAYDCQAGDTLCQGTGGSEATFSQTPYPVRWRDEHGVARQDWPVAEEILHPAPDAAVWPTELRYNASFRRQGMPQPGGDQTIGDFYSLKQMLTGESQVQAVLIQAYQYVIAKYDADGFRIDTLKYINRDFARDFGNAMREYALTTGKKNFFTFGEVAGDEQQIARFIGRNVADPGDLMGVDAALDFPLFYTLPGVAKGLLPPASIAQMYQTRKQVELDILSSHGEASSFFVTFLDNHDQTQRFYFRPDNAPDEYDDQVTLGLACLFSLQGIPCLYYGTEQGLHGHGSTPEAVREALWGKEPAFDRTFPFYEHIQKIAQVRASQPALRYGRQYFRPVSGDHAEFEVSTFAPGVVAFSRILSDEEVVVVANTTNQDVKGLAVIVDYELNAPGTAYQVLYSNKATFIQPGEVEESSQQAIVYEVDGTVSHGAVKFISVTLQPMEVQILRAR